MKKSSKILLSLVVVVALLAIIYRLVNKAPSSELAPNEQIVEVMTDGGCLFCHSANPEVAFFCQLSYCPESDWKACGGWICGIRYAAFHDGHA